MNKIMQESTSKKGGLHGEPTTPKPNITPVAQNDTSSITKYEDHTMFAIYAIHTELDPDINNDAIIIGDKTSHRFHGWYPTFGKAEEAVNENRTDLHEYLYNYIVIQEIPWGVGAVPEEKKWYEWSIDKDCWTPITRPKCFCHWSFM